MAGIMICPCAQRSDIQVISGKLACTGNDCINSGGFPCSRGQPNLIPFGKGTIFQRHDYDDSSDSIVPVRTRNFVLRALSGLLNVRVGTTAENLAPVLARLESGARVLVVGGGTIGNGLAALYERPDIELHAFDVYPSANTEILADAHFMPYRSGTFSLVVIQAVLEHVLDPDEVVAEIHRVLEQGGTVYSEVPFMQAVHEGAYDFTRFSLSGHIWLFRNFKVDRSGPHGGPAVTFAWSLKYLIWAVLGKTAGRVVFGLAFPILALLDRAIPRDRQIDGASGTWICARKAEGHALDATDVPALYAGNQR